MRRTPPLAAVAQAIALSRAAVDTSSCFRVFVAFVILAAILDGAIA